MASLPGVRVSRPGQDYAELDVPRDLDPERILKAALDAGERVTNFLIADPSIEEIFIERVGRPPSEDHHLAVASPSDSATPPRAAA